MINCMKKNYNIIITNEQIVTKNTKNEAIFISKGNMISYDIDK